MRKPAEHRVACAVLIRDSRVLLVHRSPARTWFPNVWDFPGGHLDGDETPQDAVVRELWEELQIEAQPPSGEPLLTFSEGGLEMSIWQVEQWSGEVVNAAPEEHDAIGWFTVDELNALTFADDEYLPMLVRVLLASDPAQ